MTAKPDPSVPDFEEAIDQLKTFLISQELSPHIVWIFRDDVVWHNGSVCVKVPLSGNNFGHAQLAYDDGLKNDLGIRIEVLGLLNEVPVCYVWLPKDKSEAERNGLLMAKFFLSIPSPLQKLQSVESGILWYVYRLFERKSDWLSSIDRLPTR